MQHNNVLQKDSNGNRYTLLNWEAAFEAGANFVGGKAWNLARLNRYGFNVPKGCVIPIGVYERFIADNQLLMELEKIKNTVSLANVTQEAIQLQIQQLHSKISNAAFSDEFVTALKQQLIAFGLLDSPVAVRSSATWEDSATASFAGIHESFLNVKGMDNIVSAITDCFASLWTLRAVAYRRKMEISDSDVLPAVILMKMVDADAAGVAFSCDPASGREDVCVINANFGLGESVVNGSVDPDTYYVERGTYRSVEERLGAKQTMTVTVESGGTREQTQNNANKRVLNEEQQLSVSNLVDRVYAALGELEQHQDIEWAVAGDKLYLLQARPVTALPRYTEEGLRDKSDIWSNANFRDAVPMVIPYLQRDSMLRNLNRTILAPFKEIGYHVKPGLMVAKYISGRAYFNTALYQWLLYDSCGMKPDDLNLFMGGHQPNLQIPSGSPFTGKSGLRRLLTVIKNIRLISRYQKHQDHFYARVDRFVDRFCNTDFDSLSDTEFLDFVVSTESEFLAFTDKYMALCGGIGPFGLAIKQLQPEFGEEAIGIVNALASGQGDLPSANQGYQLLKLAELARADVPAREYLASGRISPQVWKDLPDESLFKQGFQHYLNEYGHRATYEMDCSKPRWREDPGYLLKNIAKTIDSADSAAHKQRQQQAYDDAQKQLKQKLGFFKRNWIMSLIKQAVKGAETREKAKAYTVKLSDLTRQLFLEAGRRLYRKGLTSDVNEVFFCSQSEVYAVLMGFWNGDTLPQLIVERQQALTTMAMEKAPDVIINNERRYEQAVPFASGNQYKGIGVSAGVAQGRAQIIYTPDEGERLSPGDIMVAPSTDPAWTPLFIHAAGIVLETGGYTSHGSIVAREYGIPAVVNVAGVLQLIKNGQIVTVNANNGTVILT